MKLTIKTGIAALSLSLTISCTKENNSVRPSGINDKNSTQTQLTENKTAVNNTLIRIGTQRWMSKNLDVSHYRNGDSIPEVRNPIIWAALTTGAWCYYNNDPANEATYGKLYNWYAVTDPRGLAPAGGHIPSNAEWTTLTAFLGGDIVSGGKMKERGITHWSSPNTDGTNISGFTGLPGGVRSIDGSFGLINIYGYWWSSTKYTSRSAWYRGLYYDHGNISGYNAFKVNGFSVRCIKD